MTLKVFQGHLNSRISIIRWVTRHFLLVVCSNNDYILHRFRDIITLLTKIRKAMQKCEKSVGLGSLRVTQLGTARTIYFVLFFISCLPCLVNKDDYYFILAFHSNYVPILHRFWDIARYRSKIADCNLAHLYLTPLVVTALFFIDIFAVKN